MHTLIHRTVAAVVVSIALCGVAQAQPSCGDPPRVDDQSLKGYLDGRAQFLSKLIGDAGLKGQIETSRTDIFSKYPNASAAHSDTYLEYMFCSFVLSDPKWDTERKFHAILEMRQTIAADETHSSPNAGTKGGQSPAMVSGGNAQVNYGAAPLGQGAANPAPTPATTAIPKGTASTEGAQSPAIVSGGNSSVNYATPPPAK
jgi:hypothetical protein